MPIKLNLVHCQKEMGRRSMLLGVCFAFFLKMFAELLDHSQARLLSGC